MFVLFLSLSVPQFPPLQSVGDQSTYLVELCYDEIGRKHLKQCLRHKFLVTFWIKKSLLYILVWSGRTHRDHWVQVSCFTSEEIE
jgi:hypothetical protein